MGNDDGRTLLATPVPPVAAVDTVIVPLEHNASAAFCTVAEGVQPNVV
ncbi:MAG: hypothetical protein IPK39_16315 [Sulfuritalea sp.]|nr:hypothetical protein [Sulfuritalea sp.]